jgi:hypothetical protein
VLRIQFHKIIARVCAGSLLCLSFACGKSLPELKGIDLSAWKGDKNACNGKRALMLNDLTNERHQLQGLSEMEIVELIGRPDLTELYSRNQKFYYYYLTPGKPCGNDGVSQKLTIRFNATGAAKEVLIE